MEEVEVGAETAPQVDASTSEPDLQSQEIGTEGEQATTGEDQLFTVKVNGESIQVPLKEALAGYQRQEDYTRKTQELAQQREELTYAEQIAQALENDPKRAVQQLMHAFEVDPSEIVGGKPVTQTAPEPTEPLDPQEAFNARVGTFIEQQEMRAFQAELDADLAEMHGTFGDFDDIAVITYAAEKGIPDIKEATKAFVVDRVLAHASRQQAEGQAAARKAGLPPIAGGHGVAGGAVQTGGTAPVTDIREALALAEQAHGATL